MLRNRLRRLGMMIALTLLGLGILYYGLYAVSDTIAAEPQEELPIARVFSPPLGFRDSMTYTTRITYVDGKLVQNTDYGIFNPELAGSTCFRMPWNRTYHAGEDLYRADDKSTEGMEVTSVAAGKVRYANPFSNYPGLVVIVEHRLLSEKTVYSVYSHLAYDTLAVTAGDIVTRGQQIGTVLPMKYTGLYPQHNPSVDDDAHLHFEMRHFYDASDISESHEACNGIVPGRGYTYPEHPDDFPARGSGYADPTTFIRERLAQP